MIEKIPPEILSIIADFLQPTDRKTCLLVCKHWKDPFQESLWRSLHISKNVWIHDFMTCVKEDDLAEKSTLVKSIELHNIMNSTNHIITFLITLFPNVTNLVYSESHRHIENIVMPSLSGWEKLTHMSIRFGHQVNLGNPEVLFSTLRALPSLIHLTIHHKADFASQTAVEWEHIDRLHFHLPRLSYLKFHINFRKTKLSDIVKVRQTIPLNDLKTVDYCTSNIDIYWLYYFALKYPKLETLKLTIDNVPKKHIDPSSDQNKAEILSELPCFFPCLKNIHIIDKCNSGFDSSIIYSQLWNSGAKIENIEASLFTNCTGSTFLPNETSCAKLFVETLRNLSITKYTHDLKSLRKRRIFSGDNTFSSLVHLKIMKCFSYFMINDILDMCPVLRTLEMSTFDGGLKGEKCLSLSFHGLQNLMIYKAAVYPVFLKYISCRCRDLKYLSLSCVEIKVENLYTETFYISMPFTKLVTLSLCHVNRDKYTTLYFSTGNSSKDNDPYSNSEERFCEICISCKLDEGLPFEIPKGKHYEKGQILQASTPNKDYICGYKKSQNRGALEIGGSKNKYNFSESYHYISRQCFVVFACKSINNVVIGNQGFSSSRSPHFEVSVMPNNGRL
ncbi:hypothetical protein CLU79DRAFT_449135 [Phycomyces nitens]|nr:hypothetical protein CLU79DRAFT_449135 [Phycomyces nitens]